MCSTTMGAPPDCPRARAWGSDWWRPIARGGSSGILLSDPYCHETVLENQEERRSGPGEMRVSASGPLGHAELCRRFCIQSLGYRTRRCQQGRNTQGRLGGANPSHYGTNWRRNADSPAEASIHQNQPWNPVESVSWEDYREILGRLVLTPPMEAQEKMRFSTVRRYTFQTPFAHTLLKRDTWPLMMPSTCDAISCQGCGGVH
jgi:hypothetical protein